MEDRGVESLLGGLSRLHAKFRCLGINVMRLHSDREKGMLSRRVSNPGRRPTGQRPRRSGSATSQKTHEADPSSSPSRTRAVARSDSPCNRGQMSSAAQQIGSSGATDASVWVESGCSPVGQPIHLHAADWSEPTDDKWLGGSPSRSCSTRSHCPTAGPRSRSSSSRAPGD